MESFVEMSVLAFLLIALAGPFLTNLYQRTRRPAKKSGDTTMTSTES